MRISYFIISKSPSVIDLSTEDPLEVLQAVYKQRGWETPDGEWKAVESDMMPQLFLVSYTTHGRIATFDAAVLVEAGVLKVQRCVPPGKIGDLYVDSDARRSIRGTTITFGL